MSTLDVLSGRTTSVLHPHASNFIMVSGKMKTMCSFHAALKSFDIKLKYSEPRGTLTIYQSQKLVMALFNRRYLISYSTTSQCLSLRDKQTSEATETVVHENS